MGLFRSGDLSREVNRINKKNRKLTVSDRGTAANILSSGKTDGGVLISGGLPDDRCHIACSAVMGSIRHGRAVLILHAGNSRLTDELYNEGLPICCVSRTDAINPFACLSMSEAAYLLSRTCDLSDIAYEYICYLLELISCSGEQLSLPVLRSLISTAEMAADRLVSEQKITMIQYNEFCQRYAAIVGGRVEIKRKIDSLVMQTGASFSSATTSDAFSILEHGGVLSIDIGTTTNISACELCLARLELALRAGSKVALLLDGFFPAHESVLLKEVLSDPALQFIVSATDASALLGSELEAVFRQGASIVVFHHDTAQSTDRLSACFGEYEHRQVTPASSSSRTLSGTTGRTYTDNMTVSRNIKRIVEPREIASLRRGEFFFRAPMTDTVYAIKGG